MPAASLTRWSRRWAPTLLPLIGLIACWLVSGLLYALLARPADTFALLHVRGTRGLPAVVWAGSRDLIRVVARERHDHASLD